MNKDELKKILEKQLELLSERSKLEISNTTLSNLSHAMSEIAQCIILLERETRYLRGGRASQDPFFVETKAES